MKIILKRSKLNNILISFFIIICCAIVTNYLSMFFLLGDQKLYIRTYATISQLNFLNAYTSYCNILGSIEITHFLMTFIFSNILCLEKVYFNIFINILLALGATKLLMDRKANLFIIFMFIFTNFYMFVLYTSAERLKVGVVFLIFSLLVKKKKKRFILSLFAVLGHLQTLLIYFGIFLKDNFQKIFIIKKYTIITIVFASLLLLPLHSYLLHKIQFYMTNHVFNTGDIIKPFVFYSLTMLYLFNKKIEISLIFIPLLLASALIGGNRIVILAYFAMLYYLSSYKKGLNLPIILTSIYYAIKSYFFIINIIEYGNGFYGANGV